MTSRWWGALAGGVSSLLLALPVAQAAEITLTLPDAELTRAMQAVCTHAWLLGVTCSDAPVGVQVQDMLNHALALLSHNELHDLTALHATVRVRTETP